jgi:signal transduction histidine kinase/ligand-binding sensor domain-containing protein
LRRLEIPEVISLRNWSLVRGYGAGLLALLAAVHVAGIAAEYRFDRWTAENGLPHNSVKWLIQTNDGYLWATTGSGLVRFDGLRFTVFTSSNTPGILSDRYVAYALLEARDGSIWAGTRDRGMVRYRDGVFTAFTAKDGLPDDQVLRIDQDEQGVLWVFTSKGLAHWRQDRFVPAEGPEFRGVRDPDRLGDDSRFMGLWRIQGNSWERFAHGKWSRFPVPSHVAAPKELAIKSIFEDGLGRLWYNVRDRPREYYCVCNGLLEIYRDFPPDSFVFYKDRNGGFWITDHQANTAIRKGGRTEPTTGLASPTMMRVLEDRDGEIWAATLNEGLFRRRRLMTTSLPHPSGPELVGPLLEDRNGQIWIGGVGLVKYSPGNPRVFPRRPDRINRMGPSVVTALFADADGGLWAGFQEGVARFIRERFVEQPQLSAVLKRRVTAIHRSRDGDMWIGGEDGLVRLQGETMTHFTSTSGLGGDRVTALLEDRAGGIWVGMEEGLSHFDGKRFVALNAPLRAVKSLHEDAEGGVWAGTDGHGLFLIAGARVSRFTAEQGLGSNNISQVLEDERGFLWLGTSSGLVRVRKQELQSLAQGSLAQATSTQLGIRDGLLDAHFDTPGQPSAIKSRTGKLWFASHGAITIIDPAEVPVWTAPLPVYIEECAVEDKAVPCRSGLVLQPSERNLEIRYTAINYYRPEENRFRYRLLGLDSHWTETGARRTAYLSRLPAGEYEFEVTAANGSGVWPDNGPRLKIVVLPPFYSTWWFRAAGILTLILGIMAAFHYRMRTMKQAHALQQAFSRRLIATQESERQRIAAELHDGLGQRLVIIQNLALLQLRASAENGNGAAGHLEGISNEASVAIREMREISYDLRPYQLDILGLTKAIEGVIRTVGTASEIAFSSTIDNIDDLLPSDSQINFYRIVQECLNNIVKHSAATEASVVIACGDGRIQMTIKDNGKGFTPGSASAQPDSGGFGLIGISERAQLLGGAAEFRSAPGAGVQVTVEINVKTSRDGA